MASKIGSSGRTRNYATVVYPESAPENWMSLLADQCVPTFVSPLHNQDKNPDGEDKKAHYHVMIMFENVKTVDQAKAVFDIIGGVGCEVVQSLRGYARYLCHLDNPDKCQYDPEAVRSFSGADYLTAVGLPTDKYKVLAEMSVFIEDNDIHSYAELFSFARDNRYDWFRVLCDSGTYAIKAFLKSRSWESREIRKQQEKEQARKEL